MLSGIIAYTALAHTRVLHTTAHYVTPSDSEGMSYTQSHIAFMKCVSDRYCHVVKTQKRANLVIKKVQLR